MDSYKKMRLFILLPLESEVTKPLDFRDGRKLVEDVKQRLGKEKKKRANVVRKMSRRRLRRPNQTNCWFQLWK